MRSNILNILRRLSSQCSNVNRAEPCCRTKQLNVVNNRKKIFIPLLEEPDVPKVKIGILGADTKAGTTAAFLLKQYPLIGKLFLHGLGDVKNLARGLQTIDTSCRVEGFEGDKHIPKAIRAADVVLIMDVDEKNDDVVAKFNTSASRIVQLAKTCAIHCPRAVIVLCVEPVCCTVPLFERILKKTPWFHPSKLLGSVSYLQTRANAIAGKYLYLDPSNVHVPILGGPDYETVVPVLSLMTPQVDLGGPESEYLIKLIKKEKKIKTKPVTNLCEGFAAARLAITITRGMSCFKDAITTALVSTRIGGKIRHLVTPVRFGEGGITENYGVPRLSTYELDQLERSLVKLDDRHKVVMNYKIKNINYALKCP